MSTKNKHTKKEVDAKEKNKIITPVPPQVQYPLEKHDSPKNQKATTSNKPTK
jgi:hypothetical protein